jgi:hypothetical protein
VLPFLFEHDMIRAPLFRHALSRYWAYMQKGMTDDLMSYYAIKHNVVLDTWEPYNDPLPPEDATPGDRGWHFHRYRRGVRWGDAACRILHCSVLAHHYAHGFCPGALDLARRMMARLDNQRLLWMIDPDGEQLHRLDEWMGYSLSSDVPAVTLRAYWFARLHGIEL